MSQDRLNGLAMCSIEKNMLDSIDLDTVTEDFAWKIARKSHFLWLLKASRFVRMLFLLLSVL
jgi:hypothetical protein